MALGRTDVQMRLAAQFAALWLVGLILSVWYGIEAVAAAYSLCALLFTFWSLRVSLPLVGCSFRVYARAFLWPTTLTVAAVLLYRSLCSAAPDREIVNVCLRSLWPSSRAPLR